MRRNSVLTLVVRFCFYAHLLRLGEKKSTANLKESTTAISKTVISKTTETENNNTAAKTSIISLKLWDMAYKFQRQIWDLRACVAREVSQVIVTATDNRK